MRFAAALALALCSCTTGEQWRAAGASSRVEVGRYQGDSDGSLRVGKEFDQSTSGYFVGWSWAPFAYWQVQRVRLEPALAPEPPIAPAKAPGPVFESCDAPHPRDPAGKLWHDYMRDGSGELRCWYCDAVYSGPSTQGTESRKAESMSGGVHPIGGTIAVCWNYAGQDVDASTIREPEWSVDEWISRARLRVVEKMKSDPVLYSRGPLAAISLGFVSDGKPYGLEVNATQAADSPGMERLFLRLFDAELADHRPDAG